MAITRRRSGWRRYINLVNVGAVVIAVLTALPLYWMAASSFKTQGDVTTYPPSLFPSTLTVENYTDAFDNRILLYLGNSVIISVVSTAIVLGLALFAGYGLARPAIRGRHVIMTVLLMLSVFPIIAVLTPIYLIERSVGLLNSYPGLIIPYVAFNLPFAIWIMRNYLQRIPASIEEASEIDGAGPLGTLMRVILPMSAPGMFTVGVFTFTATWSEFLMALTINSSDSFRTIPVGLALFGGEYSIPYGTIFAASMIATIPIVILVLVFRRSVVSGLTSGAVKG